MRVQRVTDPRSQRQDRGDRQLQLGDGLATGRRGPLGQQLTHRYVDGGAGHMSGLGGLTCMLVLQVREENIRSLDLDLGRNAAREPVLHPLHPVRHVIAQQAGQLRGPAMALDDVGVGHVPPLYT
jgi:hypothetical protein